MSERCEDCGNLLEVWTCGCYGCASCGYWQSCERIDDHTEN